MRKMANLNVTAIINENFLPVIQNKIGMNQESIFQGADFEIIKQP